MYADRPRDAVLGDAGQHHHPVVAPAEGALLAQAVPAPGAQLVHTAHLQRDTWHPGRTGRGRTLQQDLRNPLEPDHAAEIPSFFQVSGSMRSSRR